MEYRAWMQAHYEESVEKDMNIVWQREMEILFDEYWNSEQKSEHFQRQAKRRNENKCKEAKKVTK